MHYGSILIHIRALFGALLLKAWSSVARDVSADYAIQYVVFS